MENTNNHPTASFAPHSYQAYDLDRPLAFGKYKGQALREVLAQNPNYLRWLAREFSTFWLTSDALAELPSDFFTNAERQALAAKADAYVQQCNNDEAEENEDHEEYDDGFMSGRNHDPFYGLDFYYDYDLEEFVARED